MRVFIGVNFDNTIRQKLIGLRDSINYVKAKPTSDENIHLTLKFIGDLDALSLDRIQKAVFRASAHLEPFTLDISGVGTFRNGDIIWAGVKVNEGLANVKKEIDNELATIGYLRDNIPYHPHITLLRQAQQFNLDEIDEFNYTTSVTQISLFDSTRENGRLLYKVVTDFSLSANVMEKV